MLVGPKSKQTLFILTIIEWFNLGSICTLESGIMLKHVAAISIKIPLRIKNDFVCNDI